ncbi:MAG TPA: Holliday junction branch migration protein RuvA [Desulfomonilia bacterium]|nr:Holliday junction branch migration protein RuvA [Desulfomonilia bacterium]
MISMLKGHVEHQSGTEAVLMVGGVGYLVHVPAGTHLSPPNNGEVTLFTMLIVRQDCMDLYGFVDQRQREIFALLLNVSGIGPKTAMNIIASVEPNRFLDEVVSENIAYLMGLPGIGNKSAQRIVLELKERIAKNFKTQVRGAARDMGGDAVAALVTLGYSESQARKAVSSVKADTVEDLVRKALKELL